MHIKIYQSDEVASFTMPRSGESKIGEEIKTLSGVKPEDLKDALQKGFNSGARYALLGIPEDIGPRANCGRGGSDEAWSAFLAAFLNIQANQYLDASKILLLGSVELADLSQEAANLENSNPEHLKHLRELCAQIDERVAPIVKEIALARLEPIVIGGGHNNAYPIIKGVVEALKESGAQQQSGMACVNCDPHTDFRPLEGRHSGNGFRYAHHEGYLKAYYVLGLHESYNSRESVKQFEACGFKAKSYEEILVRRQASLQDAMNEALAYLSRQNLPVGVELDLDSIAFMPVSAETPCGLTSEDSAYFVHAMASKLSTAYLHIAEGAPKWHHDGKRYVGRSIALQVISYIKAKENKQRPRMS